MTSPRRTRQLLIAMFLFLMLPTLGTVGSSVKGQSAQEEGETLAHIPVIWRDPGTVELLDFVWGPGGPDHSPKPAFTFVNEDLDGSNPKVRVTDADGVRWTIKFGPEVHAEVFASRMAWAAGYFVEPSYFVGIGKIDGVKGLTRAKEYIGRDGSFVNGCFKLKAEKDVEKLGGKDSWRWDKNPFLGTKELSGLKVMMMLVSNFDNKDARDLGRGSNTAIFLHHLPGGLEARYAVTDWGGSMGRWGGYVSRSKWDCKGYLQQTPMFVKGVKNGFIEWGWSGQHTENIADGIPIVDVKWLLQYLGRISDDQLRAGLQASGATPEEVERFAEGIRNRIQQLSKLALMNPE